MHLISKIPLPSAVNRTHFVCMQNADRQEICYYTSRENAIECSSHPNTPYCKINFRTTNPDIMRMPIPKGIWTNIERGDTPQNPIYYLVGTFSKADLPTLLNITGKGINYHESVDPFPKLGYGTPPDKCKWVWNMGREECRPYAESTQWKLGLSSKFPFVAWKQKDRK